MSVLTLVLTLVTDSRSIITPLRRPKMLDRIMVALSLDRQATADYCLMLPASSAHLESYGVDVDGVDVVTDANGDLGEAQPGVQPGMYAIELEGT